MEWPSHAAAWYPSRVEIAGRRLAPPALGHWRLLECARSPFAVGGRAAPEDTALALAVLSRPWRRARRMLRGGWRLALATAFLRASAADARALGDWLAEVWRTPERFVKDGAPRRSPRSFCAPESELVAAEAVAGGWLALLPDPVPTVWDAPLPMLLLAGVAAREVAGAEFETAEEAEMAERRARHGR